MVVLYRSQAPVYRAFTNSRTCETAIAANHLVSINEKTPHLIYANILLFDVFAGGRFSRHLYPLRRTQRINIKLAETRYPALGKGGARGSIPLDGTIIFQLLRWNFQR